MFTSLGIVDSLLIAVFPLAMIFAGLSDMLTMRISNKLSLVLIIGFAVFAARIGLGWEQAGMHVLVAFAVLAIGFAGFSMGWMGGGDAKMAASIALWFGGFHTLQFLLIAAVFGGALTLVILFARRIPLPTAMADIGWVARLHNATNGVPYGIALAAGALVIYPETLWLAAVLH
ncbi:MAG: peptidase [Hyphomicrobiales bacterium]|nr:MAG: peptidase [Hyphomicrobiales bacterium]